MRNLLLTISYKGTNYHGFQVQKNAVTVCEVLQNAMETLLGERPDVKGCSRTDAGVHANKYCVSFRTENPARCMRIARGLDALLPDDIAVCSCREVSEEFHARYSCKGKRYIYKIWDAPYMSPFLRGLALHHPKPVDEYLLDAVCTDFVGKHDFSAFAGAKNEQEDSVREIYDCSVSREGNLVTFSVTGDGFLYNMVRIMAGTLLAVNDGKIAPDALPGILASKDRGRAGKTARAEGLYLDDVFYDEDGEEDGE
ncbi:MAG TPA: tRNA pseudouridine(38-40) synthase TruA [Oscillospiraceae bacterium]|nr:tRNA pseudouridine(38-40) synthase TruA [Oscillospiraceae bacterium]HNW03766.1 tRNA pseudouridine(38-40) synthase TruA [Oscillospiraceae bacterium]HPV99919.1 tRNA pseudouridine(38-40) synthase TruA [Oscillospiraceae bacterium]